MKRSKPHRQGARLWLANGLVPNLWVLVLVARYLAKGQVLVFGPGYRFLCPTKKIKSREMDSISIVPACSVLLLHHNPSPPNSAKQPFLNLSWLYRAT